MFRLVKDNKVNRDAEFNYRINDNRSTDTNDSFVVVEAREL